MKKAYSYIRFSSERQSSGTSHQRQEELLQNFLTQNPDYQLQNLTFKDLGVSGYSGEHIESGALSQFLDGLKSGVISTPCYLLVESIDRLGRLHGAAFLKLLLELFDFNITIITLEDDISYTRESFNNSAAYVLHAKIQQAHHYSAQLSERLQKARQSTRDKVKDGTLFKITTQCPSWLRWCEEENTFLPIPERVEIVNKIFTLYVNGLGTTAIANQFNTDNTPSFNGKGWHSSYIHKILFDRKVIGELSSRSGEIFSHYYPQVISTELFLQASTAKSHRSKTIRTTDSSRPIDILSNIVVCECGSPCKLLNKGNNTYIYKCRESIRQRCTQSDAISVDTLYFHALRYIDAIFIKFVDTQTEDYTPETNITDIEQELSSLKTQRKRLRSQLTIADEDELSEIEEELSTLRLKISDTTMHLTSLQEQQSNTPLLNSFPSSIFGDYLVKWNCFKDGEEYFIPSQLITNANQYLLKKGIRITLSKPYTAILKSGKGDTYLTVIRPSKTTKAHYSRTADNTLYLRVHADDSLDFGDAYEHPTLPKEHIYFKP